MYLHTYVKLVTSSVPCK